VIVDINPRLVFPKLPDSSSMMIGFLREEELAQLLGYLIMNEGTRSRTDIREEYPEKSDHFCMQGGKVILENRKRRGL
jgi:hypothetical protein